jgi:hypothetical protein
MKRGGNERIHPVCVAPFRYEVYICVYRLQIVIDDTTISTHMTVDVDSIECRPMPFKKEL